MKVTYPTHIRWHRSVNEDSLLNYGTSNQKRLISSLKKLSNNSIRFEYKKLDSDFLKWFEPEYIKNIGSKNNAVIHNLYEKTLDNKNISFPLYSLTLYENTKKVGGTIFSLRDDMLAVHFRIYPQKWNHAKIQANPSLVSDYSLSEYANTHSKKIFSHGQDRNPYGLNASIGLANFKLSVGCKPKIPKDAICEDLDLDLIKNDALFFTSTKPGAELSKAYLITKKADLEKHNQLIKNLIFFEPEIIFLD